MTAETRQFLVTLGAAEYRVAMRMSQPPELAGVWRREGDAERAIFLASNVARTAGYCASAYANGALSAWIDRAWDLESDAKASAQLYARRDAHWGAITREMIREGSSRQIERLLVLIGRWNASGPWQRPGRGGRGGSTWEWVNVEARNRLAQLEREADQASMGEGHNSRRSA